MGQGHSFSGQFSTMGIKAASVFVVGGVHLLLRARVQLLEVGGGGGVS